MLPTSNRDLQWSEISLLLFYLKQIPKVHGKAAAVDSAVSLCLQRSNFKDGLISNAASLLTPESQGK